MGSERENTVCYDFIIIIIIIVIVYIQIHRRRMPLRIAQFRFCASSLCISADGISTLCQVQFEGRHNKRVYQILWQIVPCSNRSEVE